MANPEFILININQFIIVSVPYDVVINPSERVRDLWVRTNLDVFTSPYVTAISREIEKHHEKLTK